MTRWLEPCVQDGKDLHGKGINGMRCALWGLRLKGLLRDFRNTPKHRGCMRKKLLAIGSALAMTLLCASTASALAINLTVGDANYVGVIIDGIPPNDALEPLYVNSLIQVAPGDSDPCILAPSEACNRVASTLAIALPAVDASGQQKTETPTELSGNVLVNGW